MPSLSRRTALRHLLQFGALAAGALPVTALRAQAAAWPSKPIRIVVPFNVGTPPDITSRLIAEALTPALGQTVFVENRPGAVGTIGLAEVLRQPADGHNLFCMLMPVTTAPALLPNLRIDLLKDIEPVAQIDWTYSVLVVNKDLPATRVDQLIALMRAKPGGLSFGSGGNGTPAHLAGEMFKVQQKVSAVHVPYAQFGQAVPDLISGRLQFMFLTSNVAVPQVQSGRLRALAVVGNERLAALPAVPTMAQEGLPEFDTRSWDGIVVKAGTPREIVDRLNREIRRAVESPRMRERFAELGMAPASGTPQEFGALIQRDMKRWAELIRAAGIRIE